MKNVHIVGGWGEIALSLQWYMFQVHPTIVTLSNDWGSKRDAKNMQHLFCQALIANVSSRTSCVCTVLDKPYWRRDYLNRLFPVPVSVKRRMHNYDAYLDRSPEASYGTTGLRLALIFLHGRIFVLVH